MSAYITPIKVALLVFPFLALAISMIFFVIQYRKYGRVLFYSGQGVFLFVLYFL
jgi:hypothetical protein